MRCLLLPFLVVSVFASSEAEGTCGRPEIPPRVDPEDRIIDGEDADPGTWPWQAALYLPKHEFHCGGALINNRYVLTAAHCMWELGEVIPTVRLGAHNYNPLVGPGTYYLVEEVCSHPNYTENNISYDIAIMKLRGAVAFEKTISPVCLPHGDQTLPEKAELYTTGWGSTIFGEEFKNPNVLKQARMEKVDCRDNDPTDVICAQYWDGNPHQGDSGGPLVHRHKGVWTLYGLVNCVFPDCINNATFPAAFTKVSHYIDTFINKYIDPNTSREDIKNLCKLAVNQFKRPSEFYNH